MIKSPLSKVIDIISGGTPKTDVREYWENGTIGWLSVTDFNNNLRYVYNSEKKITEAGLKNSNTKLLSKGDIIISARGTVGALAQIGEPMCFNQSCFGLRGKKNIIDTDFLFYYLKNYVSNIKKRSQGSVFDTINLASFDLMEIEYPQDIKDQQKITSVLSALDSKIELNNKINEELEAMAKTIYDYWFVQFDFPNAKGKPYKSSGGKMVWSEELNRNIPEGWSSLTLDNLGDIVGGSTPSRDLENYFTYDGIPWITPKDLSLNIGKKFIKKGELDVTEQGKSSASLSILPRGSVLMSSRAPVGYLAIARNDVTTNQGFKSFVPKLHFTTEYLYYTIKNLLPVIENNASGSTFKEVSGAVLKTIYGLAPKENIVNSYTEIVKPIFSRQEILEEENQQLASLRDWLLPMLMNGQVKVKDAENIVEEKLGMVAESEEKYSKMVKLPIPEGKEGFAKQVLAGKIVNLFKGDKEFTHIKFQKLQYLSEHFIEEDLDWYYYRKHAGPYDPRFMNTIAGKLKFAGWYEERNYKFYPLQKVSEIEGLYTTYFSQKIEKLNHLFSVFKNSSEKLCEAVATVYAVWNNHIIQKLEYDEQRIKKEFFEWSNRKQKVFTEDEFGKTLEWMKKHQIIPTGFGQLIREAKKTVKKSKSKTSRQRTKSRK
ncbi:MAG: restriction endonuclease subunit S [Bacteroidia bacterium]